MRINKYLAESGVASRRESDRMVEAGRVEVDGRKAKPGDIVEDDEIVTVDGQAVRPVRNKTYLLFHKPVGLITTTAKDAQDTVMDALRASGRPLPDARLFPVGRLDVASSGLLLITDDANVADRLLKPAGGHEKEYVVEVDKPVTENFLKALRAGVQVLGRKTRPAGAKKTGEKRFAITLTEGRHRQIRRMCEALGYKVMRIHRVRIMHLRLGDLKAGQWRHLTKEEVAVLKRRLSL